MSQQQYQEMFQDYLPARSPIRGYNSTTLSQQPLRHYENYGPSLQQGLFPAEDYTRQGYENRHRFDTNRTVSAAMHANYGYDNATWNYGAQNGGVATLTGVTSRMKPPTARRAGIPNAWLDSDIPPVPQLTMHPISGHYKHHPEVQQNQAPRLPSPAHPEEDLIPTAIVIKNIPFAVKKEELIEIMIKMNLPLPYAFNYHFDAGVFRGLAFANYTTSDETKVVIDRMNHLELQGRTLRVEYKKMLPAAERDRIERDKRERRGQLQEQHQPLSSSSLHNQGSMNSLSSLAPTASPSPIFGRNDGKFCTQSQGLSLGELKINMNDPATLGFYTDLMMFQSDGSRETHIFPSTVTPAERRIIHTLAHHMGLEHRSEGVGDMRQVQILRARPTQQLPYSAQQVHGSGAYFNESQKRGLNRAATIDFGESRSNDPYSNHTLGRQGSGLLDIPGSPGLSGMSAQNLRAAKSFADLRSYTPSPVPSSASFPAGLTQNIARFNEYSMPTASSGTPNLTPTSAGAMNNRDDYLFSSMNNLSIAGYDRQNAGRCNGGRLGQERDNPTSSAGPIGSQRPVNGNSYDESPWKNTTLESAQPERQPRGPGSGWGAGFSRPRQNGHIHRGSDSSDRKGQPRFH